MTNKNVFIVDSDPGSSKRLSLHVEALGFNAIHFSRGYQMMDQLHLNPCLILLAHDLDERSDGLYYLRQIKEVNRDIPVLFLLAQKNLNMAVKALRHGAASYVEKINATFESLKSIVYDLDIEKKRKYWTALKTFRQGVFSLYGIY
jgi:DNA-binding NtrC family response regulator